MKPLFDPSLISLDNQMEDFLSEHRRKNDAALRQTLLPEAGNEVQVAKPKPWKLKCALACAAIFWFWWEVGEYILRWAR